MPTWHRRLPYPTSSVKPDGLFSTSDQSGWANRPYWKRRHYRIQGAEAEAQRQQEQADIRRTFMAMA